MNVEDRVFSMIPLERTLFVEGRSRDRKVGEFRGVVLAVGWWSDSDASPSHRAWGETPPPSPLYLVSDRNKPAPVWVSTAELEQQDWISALAPVGLAPPPPPPPEGDEENGAEPAVVASEGESGDHE